MFYCTLAARWHLLSLVLFVSLSSWHSASALADPVTGFTLQDVESDHVNLTYLPTTGELLFENLAEIEVLAIESASSLFLPGLANLSIGDCVESHLRDRWSAINVATGVPLLSESLGPILPRGLARQTLAEDLSVWMSLGPGGDAAVALYFPGDSAHTARYLPGMGSEPYEAPTTIYSTSRYLLPDRAGQVVEIYANGEDFIDEAAMEFELITLASETAADPVFTAIDLTGPGMIFEGAEKNYGTAEDSAPSWCDEWSPRYIRPAVTLNGDNQSPVVADGLLARLTVDTSECEVGGWLVSFGNEREGEASPSELRHNGSAISRLNIPPHLMMIVSAPNRLEDSDFDSGTLDQWEVAGEGTAEIIEIYDNISGEEEPNHVVELTAGSPVSMTQLVDTPSGAYIAAFDYAFQSAGVLDLLVGTEVIHSISASEASDFLLATVHVDDVGLRGIESAGLTLRFDGESGSKVWVDRIELRALPVPEPSTLAMLASLSIVALAVETRRRTR